MTLSEVLSKSPSQAKKDRHLSRHHPGSASGPNKDRERSSNAELADELEAEADAERERLEAVMIDGESSPAQEVEVVGEGDTDLATEPSDQAEGLGVANVAHTEVGTQHEDQRGGSPDEYDREIARAERNFTWHSDEPDLLFLARSSAIALHRSTEDEGVSHRPRSASLAKRRADDKKPETTVARSGGTEVGSGASQGAVALDDAPTGLTVRSRGALC